MGPAEIVKPGEILEVWNEGKKIWDKVLIDSTTTVGFTSKTPPRQTRNSTAPPAETLQEYRARTASTVL